MSVFLAILQVVIVTLVAPLVSGATRLIRAKMHSRKGSDVFQDYRDIAKLMTRQEVRSNTSSFVARVMPVLYFAVMVVLACGIPMITIASPVPLLGDIITVIYLLALSRFFFSLAAVDTSSAYAGRGGLRELIVGVLVEPTMLLALFAAALVAGSTNMGAMGLAVATGAVSAPVATFLAAVAFALACYVELGKVPFDMAEAEQELQEGPLAEYSGPSLALLKLSMSMKQVIVVSWFLAIFFPFGAAAALNFGTFLLGIVAWCLKVAVAFAICAVVENSVMRTRYKLLGTQTWAIFGVSVLSFAFLIVGV